MTPTSAAAVPALEGVARRVDAVAETFLAQRRAEAVAIEPGSAEPIDEIVRLLRAGGKRIRPAFCYWGFRAAGRPDTEPIWRAAAALELLHTMALIHDDVMDDDDLRRGEPAAHARQAAAAAVRGQRRPELVGVGIAIVAGDLAATFAEQLFSSAGFPIARQVAAAQRFHRLRLQLALGAYLDLAEADVAPATVAYLKGGAYTVEGPLLVGAALAGASMALDEALRRYALPLGHAFQLFDDLADGDAPPDASREDAAALVAAAREALGPPIAPDAVLALDQLAALVGSL
ncbi:MAG: polyprenyl synthetase family protein [Actinomycetota bacterium]